MAGETMERAPLSVEWTLSFKVLSYVINANVLDVTSGVTFSAILRSKCTRFNGKWDRVCRNVAKEAYRMLQYNKYH